MKNKLTKRDEIIIESFKKTFDKIKRVDEKFDWNGRYMNEDEKFDWNGKYMNEEDDYELQGQEDFYGQMNQNSKEETNPEVGDDMLILKIGDRKGKYWPWYFKKMNGDSTHFYMANNKETLNTSAAIVHHVGQHKGESYYTTLVAWLHGKINPKDINGREFKSLG